MAYVPSLHTSVSKPIGIQGNATDARSRYYDATLFKYRDYVSIAEVIAYLTTTSHRTGGFPIFINSTGTLSNGVITGGERVEYWFKDGTADGDLVVKSSGGGEITIDSTPTNGSDNAVSSNGVFDALATKQDSDGDLTAIAGLSPSNDDFIQRKSGAWVNRTVAQVKTDFAVNNVDNTSDSTKNSATATLTNKTISGANNTLSNIPQSAVDSLTTDLGLKAPLASPTLTGTPVAPTADPGTNTTQIATTAFVATALGGLYRTGATFDGTLTFDVLQTGYNPLTVTSNIVIDIDPGTKIIGGTEVVQLIGDGTHLPDFSACELGTGSPSFNNATGQKNTVVFMYDGDRVLYTVTQ